MEIISGFKGVIDYYVHDGQPCVRKWPKSPGQRRSPAVEAQWPVFTQAVALWSRLSPEVQQAYRTMASATGWTGRDLFIKSYISGILEYPHDA